MNNKLVGLMMFLLTGAFAGFAQDNDVPAFPGAEGFGKYVTGGRGGRIIYVTTLEDTSSEGSLRYAINQSGPRIVVFKVAGTIQLQSGLKIRNNDITIAGQTAPGDGITLRDYSVTIDADNVIIRFMRFRMGDETNQEADALWGRRHKNIIIDHCSMSWSTDECASFYDNENFTLQWSILSESLRNSVHEKGKHGYGGIWGGQKASFHHNLLAHHDSRNPRFCGSRYSNEPELELVDFRNNVIYNWGANSAYAAEGGSYNLVNNYYKAGPATSSSKDDRIIQPYADNGGNNQPRGIYGIFYINGNYMTASSTVTQNNWLGVSMHSSFSDYAPGISKDDIKSGTSFASGEVTTQTAETAYKKVLDFCGASYARDSVDMRIIKETSTGTVTYNDGGNGSTNGLIDTQSAVGGWPELDSGTAPEDSDNDGMPDDWEAANNLDANNPDDAQLKTIDGKYTNVEIYINSLVADIVSAQNENAISTSVSEIDLGNNAGSDISIYLNSSESKLVINHSRRIINVNVYSITGQLLISENCNTENVRMDFSALKKGIFIVAIRDDQNRFFSEKIINL